MIAVLITFAGVFGLLFLLLGRPAPAAAGVATRVAELATPTHRAPRRLGLLAWVGSLVEPGMRHLALTRALDRQLLQAGWAWRAGEFAAVSAGLGLVGAVLGGLLLPHPAAGLITGFVGLVAPHLQLQRQRQALTTELSEQLPESLMLVINALKAGNSFLQALQMVGKQMKGPMAAEFGTTVAEINWGLPVETALSNLAERVGTVDIELVVAAMLVQRETGGNLAEILHNLHDTLRDRVRIQGEVQALTAQGRLSGWVLTALPVVVGLLFFLVSPGYIQVLFTDPRGHALLGAMGAAQLLGVFFIRRIVRVQY